MLSHNLVGQKALAWAVRYPVPGTFVSYKSTFAFIAVDKEVSGGSRLVRGTAWGMSIRGHERPMGKTRLNWYNMPTTI
jgi:hypothetical protein